MKNEECICTLLSCKKVNEKDQNNHFKLQPLPYAENALEPYMSEKTVQFHYGRHLPAYIENTNKLKAGTEYDHLSLVEIIRNSSGTLFNNAAQVFNHYFQFEALAPHQEEKSQPGQHTLKMIEENFGSLDEFKDKLTKSSMQFFGSGYTWLSVNPEGKMELTTAANAGTPNTEGKLPVMNLDLWEHAYYLDVQNQRAKYIENFMKIINWEVIEERVKYILKEK